MCWKGCEVAQTSQCFEVPVDSTTSCSAAKGEGQVSAGRLRLAFGWLGSALGRGFIQTPSENCTQLSELDSEHREMISECGLNIELRREARPHCDRIVGEISADFRVHEFDRAWIEPRSIAPPRQGCDIRIFSINWANETSEHLRCDALPALCSGVFDPLLP